jgi:HEAT repeat protein
MFGNNADQMGHLVEKHQWEKVDKKLNGADAEAKVALAAACANSSDEEASSCLISLLNDSDESVQIQAIKSLGIIGSENAKTNLQWLSDHLPAGKDAVKTAAREAIAQINKHL